MPLSYASDSGVTRICQQGAKVRERRDRTGGGGFHPGGGGGAPPLLKVIGTCRWTVYDFAGHQYWHRVSNRPSGHH